MIEHVCFLSLFLLSLCLHNFWNMTNFCSNYTYVVVKNEDIMTTDQIRIRWLTWDYSNEWKSTVLDNSVWKKLQKLYAGKTIHSTSTVKKVQNPESLHRFATPFIPQCYLVFEEHQVLCKHWEKNNGKVNCRGKERELIMKTKFNEW